MTSSTPTTSRLLCRPRRHRGHAAVTAMAVAVAFMTALAALPAPSAAADQPEPCTFPARKHEGRPWSLKRAQLDRLWRLSDGEGVRVAVIDTGVDVGHPQLARAVDGASGRNFVPPTDDRGKPIAKEGRNGITDTVGHGTRVAGIIAARPARGTGFAGLAPAARIIPLQQNDAQGNGTAESLAAAIDYAAGPAAADIINISQDTEDAVEPAPVLGQAIVAALRRDVLVVASAGNDGLGGNVKETYPASYEGVLAVAASDRDNERAPFSQSGEFVGVAAPGVDMVSTVPGGGHCSADGTSFAAPYVSGVAALIKSRHPEWNRRQIAARIQQTAERSAPGHDRLVGWGVVDPLRALSEDSRPADQPSTDQGLARAEPPTPAELVSGETVAERTVRLATSVTIGCAVLVAMVAGTGIARRDARRRARRLAAAAGHRVPTTADR